MSSTGERKKRKAELLLKIKQQRLDLCVARDEWLSATARYDRGWQTIASFRRYIVLAGGALAVWNVRRPGKMMRLAKRGLSIWSTWRVARSSLNKLFYKS